MRTLEMILPGRLPMGSKDFSDAALLLMAAAMAAISVGTLLLGALSTGVTGPDRPGAGKLVQILPMWMGRLEIFAVLMLFVAPVKMWKPDPSRTQP